MSSFTTEVNLDVEVEFTCVSRGRPESGPTYSCGGEPAEPPEFQIDRVMHDGKDIMSQLSDDVLDVLREEVAEQYDEQGPDEDGRSDDDD